MTQTGLQRGRRWIAGVATALVLAAAWYIVPRLGARSPVAILVVCALAVLAMKLVEHRIHRWFRQWEEKSSREAGEQRGGGPGGKEPENRT